MSIKEVHFQEKVPDFTTEDKSQAPAVNTSGWTFINRWSVEPQRDDRIPMRGKVAERPEAASAHRSFARRSHQESFKAWSRERHD